MFWDESGRFKLFVLVWGKSCSEFLRSEGQRLPSGVCVPCRTCGESSSPESSLAEIPSFTHCRHKELLSSCLIAWRKSESLETWVSAVSCFLANCLGSWLCRLLYSESWGTLVLEFASFGVWGNIGSMATDVMLKICWIYPQVPEKCMINVLFSVFINDLDTSIECRLSLQMVLNREELLLLIMVELPCTEILIE